MSAHVDTAGGPLRVALLGCGVVGSSVARLLLANADDLAARVGRPFAGGPAFLERYLSVIVNLTVAARSFPR